MANIAFGTQFSWNAQHVADLSKINGVEVTAKAIDATTHDSPDMYTQEIPGLKTASDISLEGFAKASDSLGQMAMLTDFNAVPSPLRTSLITFPAETGTVWSVPGHVMAVKFGDATTDGLIPFTATVKPYGKPTLTIATSAGLTTTFLAMSQSAVITPAPAQATLNYVATVLTGVTSLTVTPTAAAGVITVNGSVVTSGQASSAITLGAAGSVTVITVAVTETNKAPKTYAISVVRP